MSTRRVVITGVGAVSPLGIGVGGLWEGLIAGRCGVDTIKAFDPAGFGCKLAGEIAEFKVRKYLPKSYRKAAKLMCRDIQLAIAAADEAIKDSGYVTKAMDAENVTLDAAQTGITVGAGVICCELVELAPSVAKSIADGRFDTVKWGKYGLEALTPIWLLKYLPNMPACHVGIIHDIQGPSNSITCGEAGGQLAISEAVQIISRGGADVALAGGCEGKVNPILMLRQGLLKRVTIENNDDAEGACRPFDAAAKGSVFGEGAGMMVLESLEGAEKRGAKIYAEVIGTGSSNNINSVYEHLEADGKGIEIAIEKAMADAGVSADELDLVIPHGTGIAADDKAEAVAIANALGSAVEEVTVWPTKSMLSNTGAAGGALDVIAAVKAMETGKIGAAKNCDNKAQGCRLNISGKVQDKKIRYVLCCSYTFGGQTAAVVLKNLNGEVDG